MSLPHSLFLVIFGASGDLTRRKLMPALVKIHNEGRFPPHFAIVGCARTAYSDETYRSYLKEELAKSPSLDERRKRHWMIFFPLSTISRWTLPMLLLIPG